MFWSLFVITLITEGPDTGDNRYLLLDSYESRLSCEIARVRFHEIFEVPENVSVECIKTDEA
jgi:hypothetical protein